MKDYKQFIEPNGLTNDEFHVLDNFLFDFYLMHGKNLKPGDCTLIPDLTEYSNKIQQTSSLSVFFEELKPYRYIRTHYFFAAKSRRNQDYLIIDPTGVPLNQGDLKLEEILLYFGLKSESKGFHKHVYENMKEMDEWGARDLPPKFRI